MQVKFTIPTELEDAATAAFPDGVDKACERFVATVLAQRAAQQAAQAAAGDARTSIAEAFKLDPADVSPQQGGGPRRGGPGGPDRQ